MSKESHPWVKEHGAKRTRVLRLSSQTLQECWETHCAWKASRKRVLAGAGTKPSRVKRRKRASIEEQEWAWLQGSRPWRTQDLRTQDHRAQVTCFLRLLPDQLLGLPKNWISKPGTLLSLRVESLIPPGHAVTLNNLWEFQGRRSILRGNHIWAARSNLFLEVRENVNRGCCCYCVDLRLLFALSPYCYPSMLHAWFYFRHSYVSMPGPTGSLIYLWWYRHICNLKTLLVYHRKSSRCGLRRKRDDGRHATLTSFRALSSSGVTESELFSQAARSRSQMPAAAASSATFLRHILMTASDYPELKQRFF